MIFSKEVLYVTVIIANIIALFLKKGRKFVGILSFLVLVMIIVNLKNNVLDLYNYKVTYENIYSREIGVQPLYYWLQIIFNNLNIDFDGFRVFCFISCMIGIYLILFKITDSFNTFALVYMMYFFFLDGEQIRNFMASCILVVALYFLIIDEKHSLRNYIICILIASMIHTVFIVYLCFVLLRFYLDLKKIIIRAIPIITVFIWILFRYSNFYVQLLLLIEDNRAVSYSAVKTNLGWVIPTFLYVMMLIFIHTLNKNIEKKNQCVNVIKRFRFVSLGKIRSASIKLDCSRILSSLIDINIIGLIFLPLMLGTLTFYRITKNIVFCDCVFLTAIWDYLFKNNKRLNYIKYFIWLLLIILGYCIFDFKIYNEWKNFYDCYFTTR